MYVCMYILKVVGLFYLSVLSAKLFMTLNIHEGRDGWPECVAVVVDVFSTCGHCLRSTQSVSTLEHTKDSTSGPLPPRWKTLGLA